MPKNMIRIGFKISDEERDELEMLLRAIRLIHLDEMSDNEWRRKCLSLVMTDYIEWMPTNVIELARNEPGELKRRMMELELEKGRTLSHTGQLDARRRWRAELSKKAKDVVLKANLVAAIEQERPVPVEKPADKPIEKTKVIPKKAPPVKKPKIDIEAMVKRILGDFIENERPSAQAMVTRDPIALRSQMISLWQAKGFLMRIKDGHGQRCWVWIDGDYEIAFPSDLIIEDIGDFSDLTVEESGDNGNDE